MTIVRTAERARSRRGDPRAFTLVEVLVAITVLGLNAAAMLATLSLIAALLRAGQLVLTGVDEGSAFEVCGAIAVCAFRSFAGERRPHRARTAGATLVELLIALSLSAAALLLLGSLTRSVTSVRASLDGRADRSLVEHGLRIAVVGEIARAGIGLGPADCGLGVTVGAPVLDTWWRGSDGSDQRVTFSSGVDAAGRRALYRRTHPHPRQPWIEDVTDFRVVGFATTTASRVTFVDIELAHGDNTEAMTWRIPMLNQPCIRDAVE